MLRKLLALLLLVACGVVVTAGPAAACPASGASFPQQVKRADAVFTGTVSDRARRGPGIHYTVEVQRSYKGDVDAETTVMTASSPRACGRPDLRDGHDYVFLVTEDGGDLTIAANSGTASATDGRVARVERLLGQGTSPTAAEPEQATFTRVGDPRTSATRVAAPGVALAIVGLLGLLLVVGLGRRRA